MVCVLTCSFAVSPSGIQYERKNYQHAAEPLPPIPRWSWSSRVRQSRCHFENGSFQTIRFRFIRFQFHLPQCPIAPLLSRFRFLSCSSLPTRFISSTTARSTPPIPNSPHPPSTSAPLPAPFTPSRPPKPKPSLSPLPALSTSLLLPPIVPNHPQYHHHFRFSFIHSFIHPASSLSPTPFSSPTSQPAIPTSPPSPKPALSTSGDSTPRGKSPLTPALPSNSPLPPALPTSAASPVAATTRASDSPTACSSGPPSSPPERKRPSEARSRFP